MSTQLFSIKEALQVGWETTKKNFWYLAGLLAIVFILSFIPDNIAKNIKDQSMVGYVILQILTGVLSIVVSIGATKIILKLIDGERASYNELFSHYRLFFKYLAGSILYGLTILAGFILLVVPGFIFAVKYQFINYLIVDKEMGPLEAWRESARMTSGHKWQLFQLWILTIILVGVGLLLFIVGSFVTIPIAWVAMAFVYRRLLANVSLSAPVQPPASPTV